MNQVHAELKVSANGPSGLKLLRIGERRVPFGFDEAHQLVTTWPGRLGTLAAQQASSGERLEFVLGGQAIQRDANEARQLAALPSQLRVLLDTAARISNRQLAHQRRQPR